jgi:hypothetical protein
MLYISRNISKIFENYLNLQMDVKRLNLMYKCDEMC